MAIVFLPLSPKAPGDTFAYLFKETYIIASSHQERAFQPVSEQVILVLNVCCCR